MAVRKTASQESRMAMNTRLSIATSCVAVAAMALAAVQAPSTDSRPGNGATAGVAGSTHATLPAESQLGAAVQLTPPELAKIRRAAVHAVSGPSTDRRATAYSPNWSGEVTRSTTPGTFQGVAGGWTVPAVQATATNKYSSTWVGVDGYGNSQLIQTGTEEDSINGHTSYSAWWEILPASETLIRYSNGALVPVAPGDSMWAYIVKTATANVWTIYLQDITRGWSFSTNRYYYGSGLSAEWVEEATQVGGVISPMPVFSTFTFTNLQVAQAGKWYYTALTNATNGLDLLQNGHIYAYPGAPTGTNPQHFAVYHN
jgi:hypothetical protein